MHLVESAKQVNMFTYIVVKQIINAAATVTVDANSTLSAPQVALARVTFLLY